MIPISPVPHGPSVVQPQRLRPEIPIEYFPGKFSPDKSKVEFTISILAVNGLEMTKACVESVLQGGGDFELWLTDNASTDGTGKYFSEIQKGNSKIKVIHNESNKGFSEPNNFILQMADGKFFVTLNNDTIVPTGWLDQLKKPLLDFLSAAISGPTGNCCVLRFNTNEFIGDIGHAYEYVEGSCLCIPTALARRYTLFAPYLSFAYGEDLDLSLRMRARGYTIHQTPLRIVHYRSKTSSAISFPKGVHEHNQKALNIRWGGYLRTRAFEWPIVIRRTAAFGDVLLATPLIRAINQQQPRSQVYFETMLPEVLLNNPRVKTWKSGHRPFILNSPQLINLDMAYEEMAITHIVDAYFLKAHIIPCEEDYRHTEFYISPNYQAWANSTLTGSRWVAVHPGPSTWKGKQWSMVNFSKVCSWLQQNNYRVVLVGSGSDNLSSVMDFRGRTNASQLAAIIKRCQFFIGIDSFPLHIAESVGVPVIGLFGITDPRYIMTKDSSLSIMGDSHCAGQRHQVIGLQHLDCDGSCINSITVESVIEKVKQI